MGDDIQQRGEIYTQAMIDETFTIEPKSKNMTSVAQRVINPVFENDEFDELDPDEGENGIGIVITKDLIYSASEPETTDIDSATLVKVQILGITRMIYNNLAKEQILYEFPKSVMCMLYVKDSPLPQDIKDLFKTMIQNALATNTKVNSFESSVTVPGIVKYQEPESFSFKNYTPLLRSSLLSNVVDTNEGILFEIPTSQKETIKYDDSEGQEQTKDVYGMLLILDESLAGKDMSSYYRKKLDVEFVVDFVKETTPAAP